VTFCSACNNSFQSLGAVIEGAVGWAVFRERLLDPQSPLARCAMVNYVHDEFIFEVPLDLVDAAARRLEAIMHEIPKTVMPDVVLRSKAEAMAFWSKSARRIVLDGKLRVWPLKCLCGETHDRIDKPCTCGRLNEFLSDVAAHGKAWAC